MEHSAVCGRWERSVPKSFGPVPVNVAGYRGQRIAKDNCSGQIQDYLDILTTHEGRDVADRETVDSLLVAAGLRSPSSKSATAPRLNSVPEIQKDDIPDAIIAKAVSADGFTKSHVL